MITRGTRTVRHAHGSELRDGTLREVPDIVATRDLLRWAPDAEYIPNPHPPADWLPKVDPAPLEGGLRVVHAHAEPGTPRTKGTDLIRRAVGAVKEADYVEICGVPPTVALRMLSRARLAVDQFGLGEYGMFAVEAMLMGIPTLGDGPYPILVVAPDTMDSLIRWSHDNPESARLLGEIQRGAVMAVHDPAAIAKRMEATYEA
jgi:hypothetical protein